MSSVSSVDLTAFEQYKNAEGTYDIPKNKLQELVQTKSKKQCKTSGYMKWLADNRESIKNEYFNDLSKHEKDFWTLENITKYYEKHSLKLPKKIKEGKSPNVAILVASKAGQLWKSLDQKTKDDYNEKAKTIKE